MLSNKQPSKGVWVSVIICRQGGESKRYAEQGMRGVRSKSRQLATDRVVDQEM